MSPVRRGGALSTCLLLAAVGAPTLAFMGPISVPARSGCCLTSEQRSAGIRAYAHQCVHSTRRQRGAVSMAAAAAGATMAEGGARSDEQQQQEGEDEEGGFGKIFAAIRPLTEAQFFTALQVVFVVALAGLVDAGFSGDWQARGYLSDPAAETARAACLVAAGAHAILTGAAAFVATAKGVDVKTAAPTLLTGPLGFLKMAAAYDVEELEAIAAAKAPPMSMAINSMELSDQQAPGAVMLSTSIKAKKGRESTMRKLLEAMVKETEISHKGAVFTCTVNQDPEDRSAFFMLQRFASADAMVVFQNSEAFLAFTDGAEDCVAEPMGLYLVNERSGKLSEPVHPFGPGGEGGRDDAIYSSPANLQGSLRDSF